MQTADLASVGGIMNAVVNMIGVIAMLVIYTYVDKLEKIDCPCAEHPMRNFIKNYIVFAVIFLLVATFLPPGTINSMLGPIYAMIYGIVYFVFIIATFVFFVYVMRYARFLMVNKCKCSEDFRREAMYVYSIIMVVVYGILVFLPLLASLVVGGAGLALASGKQAVKDIRKTSMDVAVSPLKAVQELPKSFRKSVKKLGKLAK